MICQNSEFKLFHVPDNLNFDSMLDDINKKQICLTPICSHACNDDEKKVFPGQFDSCATVTQDILGAVSCSTQSLHSVGSHDEHSPARKKQEMLCKGNQRFGGRPSHTMWTAPTNSSESTSFSFFLPPLSSPLTFLSLPEGESSDSGRLVNNVESHSLNGLDNEVSAVTNATKNPVFSPVSLTTAANTGTSVISQFIAAEPSMCSSGDRKQFRCCESHHQLKDLSVSLMEDKGFYGAWKVAALRRKVVNIRHIAHSRALDTINKCCFLKTVDK